MLTAERYITLLNHFAGPVSGEQDEYEATLEDLTELFHCTERNVKLIVRKLQEEELICWLPGRGRGNRSRIRFMVNRDLFLLEFAKRLAQKGEYRSAFEFLHQFEEDKTILDQFIKWLNDQFGVEKITADAQGKDVFRLPVYRSPVSLDPSMLFSDLIPIWYGNCSTGWWNTTLNVRKSCRESLITGNITIRVPNGLFICAKEFSSIMVRF